VTEWELARADTPELKEQLRKELAEWQRQLEAVDSGGMLEGMGFKRAYPKEGSLSSGSGDVDRIYLRTRGGEVELMEVKGGENYLTTRQLRNIGGDYADHRAQQGHVLYLIDIMLEMRNRNLPEYNILLKALLSNKLKYGHFHLKFNSATGDIGNVTYQHFDITMDTEIEKLIHELFK
jgi:hypothetical protein